MTNSSARASGTTAVSRRKPGLAKAMRYSVVSAISTTVSLIVLGLLVGIANQPAGWSAVISTACGMVPAFELNRRWVWSKGGSPSFAAEILPFCALSFVRLGLSTLAVHVVNARVLQAGWSRGARTATIELTNVGAFAVMWAAQFVLLDRLLFRQSKPPVASQNGVRPPHPVWPEGGTGPVLKPSELLATGGQYSLSALRESRIC